LTIAKIAIDLVLEETTLTEKSYKDFGGIIPLVDLVNWVIRGRRVG
jgi:hypothetical protein